MKVGLWSTNAGSNTAATPDGWPEGQAPSTLNDCAREMMAAIRTALQDIDYFDHGMSPTYLSANSFSVPGDQTTRLLGGRQLKMFDGANTTYRSISTASYTTVTTVQLAAGTAITASMSSFAVSIINPAHPALPMALSRVTARFDTSSTGATLGYSNNVSSVSRSAAGVYRVNFSLPFNAASYVPQVTVVNTTAVALIYVCSASATVSSYKFTIINNATGAGYDGAQVHMTAFGQ